MRQCLEKLCRDEEHNIVFIVSGDTRTVLTRVFYDLLNNGVPLGLVAHSGLCFRLPKKEFVKTNSSSDLATSLPTNNSGILVAPTSASTIAAAAAATANSSAALTAKMNILQEKAFLEELHLENLNEDQKAFLHHESHLIRSLSDPIQPLSTQTRSSSFIPPTATSSVHVPLSGFTSASSANLAADMEAARRDVSSDYQAAVPTPTLGANFTYDWLMTVDISKEWSNWMREAGVIPILRKYTWTTVGTFYRTSGITTLWDYTFADPEWGLSQANYMILELEAAIAQANLNLVVKHNKSTVQLLPKNVDKGSAVRRVFSMLDHIRPNWNGLPPDFCLCLGDDTSDEMMFAALHQYATSNSFASSSTTSSMPSGAETAAANSASGKKLKSQMFTATVGRKPTTASYYLRDSEAVSALLSEIVDASMI
jgi:trehalose-phosphatase